MKWGSNLPVFSLLVVLFLYGPSYLFETLSLPLLLVHNLFMFVVRVGHFGVSEQEKGGEDGRGVCMGAVRLQRVSDRESE